jgi:diphthine synthase
LGELVFVGMGLNDELGISLKGFELASRADLVFCEHYTSLMPHLSLESLERRILRPIRLFSRKDLEDCVDESVLEEAKTKVVVLLVPGDPMVATTHISVRIRAERLGIRTRIVHGASVVTAVMGLSGLQSYKFGKSVTVPFPEGNAISPVPYEVIAENRARGLHTLVLLDVKADSGRYMRIGDALTILRSLESARGLGVVTGETLVVGVARAGSDDPMVRAGPVAEVMNFGFGDPPHVLVFPGRLHFVEAEALEVLCGAGKHALRGCAE